VLTLHSKLVEIATWSQYGERYRCRIWLSSYVSSREMIPSGSSGLSSMADAHKPPGVLSGKLLSKGLEIWLL
jgi:hypothetical protein